MYEGLTAGERICEVVVKLRQRAEQSLAKRDAWSINI